MKNIIKKSNFLSEHSNWENLQDGKLKLEYDKLNEEDLKEYDTISELITWDFLHKSKLNGISFILSYFNRNGASDLKDLKAFLYNEGYDLDVFMSKFRDIIYEDYSFTEDCGFLDYLLYSYDNKYMLSGNDGMKYAGPDDYLLKYTYGFQTTTLGREYIKQNFDTITDFYYACADNLSKFLECENEKIEIIYEKDYAICIIENDINSNIDTDDIRKKLDEMGNTIFEGRFIVVVIGDNTNTNLILDLNLDLIKDTKLKNIMKRVKIEIAADKFNL
jgi:hypothetical protein